MSCTSSSHIIYLDYVPALTFVPTMSRVVLPGGEVPDGVVPVPFLCLSAQATSMVAYLTTSTTKIYIQRARSGQKSRARSQEGRERRPPRRRREVSQIRTKRKGQGRRKEINPIPRTRSLPTRRTIRSSHRTVRFGHRQCFRCFELDDRSGSED